MKKLLVFLCAVTLVFGMVALASATPLELSETFLGEKGNHSSDPHFTLWEGWKAKFQFDLTATGGRARLFDQNKVLIEKVLPTEDEESYDPDLYLTPFEATLNFQFSSADSVTETVRVRAGFWDGATLITQMEYDLGYWSGGLHREYAELSIDLVALGLGEYLSDGRFLAVAIAPDVYNWHENDFSIEWANLTAKANPVPEPATMLLLGTGLVGLAGFGRKKFFKK
jgi:hypothetical protein